MKQVVISELMATSGVKFGTSGARGLVTDMTDEVCYAYTLAFLNYLAALDLIRPGSEVAVAGDYRPSTPRIMQAVGLAIQHAGFKPVSCGFVPTPAVALYGIGRNIASIMVTGSHIPDDRNGIKFYKAEGEILKQDELGMCCRTVEIDATLFAADGSSLVAFEWLRETEDAATEYLHRYLNFFPENCLQGKRIGVYQHSSVAREVLLQVMQGLGAEVIALGYSDTFIPVDTEAVREEDISAAKRWSAEFNLDCVVSADGDGDRPLVSDESGNWLRGDVAGILCAAYLNAEVVVTPVSCNSAVEKSGLFKSVTRTQIGSPFVIAAMQELQQQGETSVVGYEANGGFLTATPIYHKTSELAPLATRDAVIVPLAILMAAIDKKVTISGLLQILPRRFTSSGRIQNFAPELSQQRLAPLQTGDVQADVQQAESLFAAAFGAVSGIDVTDGVRITFVSEEVLHLRPSGNAPELRCYTEADSESRAESMKERCLTLLADWI